MIGALALVGLLRRLPVTHHVDGQALNTAQAPGRSSIPWILGGIGLLALAVYLGLALGRRLELVSYVHVRLARAALAAGALFAWGVIIQRTTGNSMASPEMPGISSGASLGVIALAFVSPGARFVLQGVTAAAGSFVARLVMLLLGRWHGFAPERTLLAGVAMTTALGALVTLLLVNGDLRVASLLSWMAGSTRGVGTRRRVGGRRSICTVQLRAVFWSLA